MIRYNEVITDMFCREKNAFRPVLRVIALIVAVLTAALFYGCQANAKTEEKWERSGIRWKPETALDFELRVKPGFEYELIKGDYDKCDFKTADGVTVSLIIQGLDYAADFEKLIEYYKTSGAEKISVGKNSKTIVTVRSGGAETVSKLTDNDCLTAKGTDEQTIAAFFDSVIIKVNGEFLNPYDENDRYEVR